MKLNNKQGFTLIELLVVIAIIGILSSVVLASLNSARDKGADASVKANLNGIRASAELHYDNNSNEYTGLFASSTSATRALDSADSANGAGRSFTSTSSATVWAANAQLKSTTEWYCVDSLGNATTTSTSTISSTDASCL